MLEVSETESRSVVSDSLRPHGLYTPWNSPGQNTGVGSLSLLQRIFSTSQPRDHTQVSHIAGGVFTSWATGKPMNTGVGSLSLLQQIFPTQESNWGLLHCRQILYQLSSQGSQVDNMKLIITKCYRIFNGCQYSLKHVQCFPKFKQNKNEIWFLKIAYN